LRKTVSLICILAFIIVSFFLADAQIFQSSFDSGDEDSDTKYLSSQVSFTHMDSITESDQYVFSGELKGAVTHLLEEDNNVCVPDVVAAFNSLSSHGDTLGLNYDDHSASSHNHFQGIQRYNNYLYITRADDEDEDSGELSVFRLDSRNTEGLRFRSNRLNPYQNIKNMPPDFDDAILFEPINDPNIPPYEHAGGFQLNGSMMAVPFEEGSQSRVYFYMIDDPENPIKLSEEIIRPQDPAGTTSLTKLADDHFLLIVGGRHAAKLDFYFSQTTDRLSPKFPKTPQLRWNKSLPILSTLPDGDSEYYSYQNLSFITQCDGELYLLGSDFYMPGNQDIIDLFHLDVIGETKIQLTKVGTKDLICDEFGDRQCDLDAAGGTYIDPEGRLYFYATEAKNSGPYQTIKLKEFRPKPHAQCHTIDKAWVELFDGANFQDRNLMLDYEDRILRPVNDLHHVDGFNDKASSIQWCLPLGGAVKIYERKNYKGQSIELKGSGELEEISDLSKTSPAMNNKASSINWPR
jgi:hypothetical protein